MKLRNSKIIKSNTISEDNIDLYDKINIDKQADSISSDIEFESKPDASDTVRVYNYRKLNDIEIDLLNTYLKEDIFINSTEAKGRLEKETGLEADIITVGRNLYNLKKKMVRELAKQRLVITESNKKVKQFHLKHLMKYLEENSSIEPSEARDRLQKDTGLELQTEAVNRYLNLLKERVGSEWDNLDKIRLSSMEAYTKPIYAHELSNTHMEYLKKILEEDGSIGSIEARNKIQEETGLKLNIQGVCVNLNRLKKEMGLECAKRRKINSILDRRKKYEGSAKIKYYHLEHLYKYLKEDIFIKPFEAKNRLQNDTGLDVNISTVDRTLVELKKELNQKSSSYSDHTTQINYDHKLNNTHVEHLRKYLNEDSSIDDIKARNKLQQDTGLDVRIQTVKVCLLKLRKEMGIKPTNLNISTVEDKEKAYGYNIKDAEIELLKMYLEEDRFVSPAVAKYRIQKETGFEISIHSFKKTIPILRKELDIKNGNLNASTDKSLRSNFHFKLKDLHINLLNKYLKDDKFIGPAGATYKLQEETGLRVSTDTVQRTLKILKEKMYPEHVTSFSPTIQSKTRKSTSSFNSIDYVESIVKIESDTCLNIDHSDVKNNFNLLNTEATQSSNNMNLCTSNSISKIAKSSNMCKLEENYIEYLKRYLSEDGSIEITEARDRLQKDTGLLVRAQTINTYLSRLKKEMSLENVSQDLYADSGRRSSKGNILNGTRLEFLEVYFNENSSITPSEAKKKLQEETGLEVDIVDVRKTLNMFRKEM
jgi:hypothetical protein